MGGEILLSFPLRGWNRHRWKGALSSGASAAVISGADLFPELLGKY